MSKDRHFNPSKTFKVVKNFVEGGRRWKEGDIYKPRFGSSKRLFRHWVARRIEIDSSVTPAKESINEEKKVDEGYTQTNEDVATVVVDDGEDFQVKYQGVQFPIKRNQLREDGTLTSGGLKAYKNSLES